ncbi:MAG: rhodanese-like domain-containing protein [Myxococcales bacterium]|nr:rhodanese-like domain-containing protein [Myxococcales bacterium]
MLRNALRSLAFLLPFPVLAAPPDDAGRKERIDAMYATYRKAFADVPEIDAATLRGRLERGDDLLLVDVRPAEERDVATIPGAIADSALDPARDRGRTIVVFCTIGARSGAKAKELRDQGYSDVLNLEGSLLSWTHAGGPLVDREGRSTHQVHVYGPKWNLVADGYQGVVTKDGAVVPL